MKYYCENLDLFQEVVEYPESPDFSGFTADELKYYLDILCNDEFNTPR